MRKAMTRFSRPCAPLLAVIVALAAVPSGVRAETYCAAHGALGESVCTVDAGRLVLETGLASWSHDSDDSGGSHALNLGETVLRGGIDAATEVRFGFSGWSNEWTGRARRKAHAGDLEIGIVRRLHDGASALALAVQATIPTGSTAPRANAWTLGMGLPLAGILPAGPLGRATEFKLEPGLAWVPDAAGTGRHLAWDALAGLVFPAGETFSIETDLSVARDPDPVEPQTDARAAAILTWAPDDRLQVSLQLDVGLTADAPRHALTLGVAKAF